MNSGGNIIKRKILTSITVVLISFFSMYITYKTMNSRKFQLVGEIIPKVNTKEKVVALTIDDGPTEKTEEILKVLEEAGIKATFFVTGKDTKEELEQAKKIVAAGHELGNHTYSHKRMIFKSPSFIKEEIEKTDEIIKEAGYKGEIFFRPPNGKKLALLPYYLNINNRKTITWNLEPDSYPEIASSSEKTIHYINENIEPGSIILLHVMYDNEKQKSLESIKGIVSSLKDKGYEFKTISNLLEYQDK